MAQRARGRRVWNQLTPAAAFIVTMLAASCVELPDTQLKYRGGAGGRGANGSSGHATNGGVTGVTTAGTSAASGNGGGFGAGGTNAAGAANGTGGSSASGTGGATARGGNGASGGTTSQSGGAGKNSGGRANGTGGSPTSGGGESDGGAPEAGAPSGGTAGFSTNRDDFFGDSRCKNSGFALCEDFESGSLDTATWKARGAAPAIETVRAARGTHSAHFHTTDNGLSYITQTKTFPAPNDTYYARVFVWFDALPTAPAWAHWTISGAQEGTSESAPEIRVGGQFDSNHDIELFGVGTDRGDTGDWTNLDADPAGKPKAVPAKEWVCVEWMFDGSANQTKFWWDGVEHPSLATSSTNHGGSSDPFVLPQFDSMWIGWWLYQANTDPPQFDVWFDEVAVDYARIGCSR